MFDEIPALNWGVRRVQQAVSRPHVYITLNSSEEKKENPIVEYPEIPQHLRGAQQFPADRFPLFLTPAISTPILATGVDMHRLPHRHTVSPSGL